MIIECRQAIFLRSTELSFPRSVQSGSVFDGPTSYEHSPIVFDPNKAAAPRITTPRAPTARPEDLWRLQNTRYKTHWLKTDPRSAYSPLDWRNNAFINEKFHRTATGWVLQPSAIVTEMSWKANYPQTKPPIVRAARCCHTSSGNKPINDVKVVTLTDGARVGWL